MSLPSIEYLQVDRSLIVKLYTPTLSASSEHEGKWGIESRLSRIVFISLQGLGHPLIAMGLASEAPGDNRCCH